MNYQMECDAAVTFVAQNT